MLHQATIQRLQVNLTQRAGCSNRGLAPKLINRLLSILCNLKQLFQNLRSRLTVGSVQVFMAPMGLNLDVLHMVAEHIEPNPVVYCRLLSVSKVFYQVFSSDTLWGPLNVYGWDGNVLQSFIEAYDNDDLELFGFWSGRTSILPQRKNAFTWLGCLLNRDINLGLPPQAKLFPHLKSCLLKLRPHTMAWYPSEANNLQLARELVARQGCVIRFFSDQVCKNRQLALVAVSMTCSTCKREPDHFTPFHYVSPHFQDDQQVVLAAATVNVRALEYASPQLLDTYTFAIEVVKINPRAVQYLGDSVRNDRSIWLKLAVLSPLSVLDTPFETDENFALQVVSINEEAFLPLATFHSTRFLERAIKLKPRRYLALSDRLKWSHEGLLLGKLAASLQPSIVEEPGYPAALKWNRTNAIPSDVLSSPGDGSSLQGPEGDFSDWDEPDSDEVSSEEESE